MPAETPPTEIVTNTVPDPPDQRDHPYEIPADAPPPPGTVSPDEYRRLVGHTWHQRGEECTGFSLAAIATACGKAWRPDSDRSVT